MAEKENPGVAKRVVSTAAKAVGKGLEKIPELNEYLDKKYGEYVPKGEVSDAVRKTLFGDDPKKMTEAGKKATEILGKDSYFKKGGAVKKYAKDGKVSSASARADGIAQRGKTRGKMV